MLLAFDTATALVSVALHDSGGVVAQAAATQPMRHGEQLAPLIAQVLAEAGVDRRELTGIGVGVGPGPFTGLRVGLVTARTLGHVLGIEVHGVCSLDVIAAEVVASGAAAGAEFSVATDARRREVYLASYDAAGARLAGPEVLRPTATARPTAGEGPVLYPDAFTAPIAPVRPAAAWLAKAIVEGLVPLGPPEPMYLRRPDAQLPAASTKSTLGR